MKTVIRNAKLYDGQDTVMENASIVFDEKGIIQVSSKELTGDRMIDATGKTVMPGLFDCHVHLGITADPYGGEVATGALAAWQAHKFLEYGITTVRCCGSRYNADITLRELIDKRIVEAARIVASGNALTITGGHAWNMSHECDTVEEIVKATRKQLKAGADQIKLFATGGMGTKASIPNMPQFTMEEMRAAVGEAEKRNALTCAHATGLDGARKAIAAGVRSIEHTQLDRDTTRMMKEKGAYYCSTIVTRYSIVHCKDPKYAWLRDKAQPGDVERMLDAIRYCKEYGVTLCAGTDAGFNEAITPVGKSLHQELQLYTQAGLSPLEALRTATYNGAKLLRLEEKTGALRPGLAADVIVIDGDPTRNIQDVSKVIMTFREGRLLWEKRQ